MREDEFIFDEGEEEEEGEDDPLEEKPFKQEFVFLSLFFPLFLFFLSLFSFFFVFFDFFFGFRDELFVPTKKYKVRPVRNCTKN